MIDTHTHLYLPEFEEDIERVINDAINVGVEKFYLPAISSTEMNSLIALEASYPGKVFAMTGLHPCSVKENYREELDIIESQLSTRSFAGIGETGLDFYWDSTYKKEQYESVKK